jgi:o-succinylbenzoate synthase
MIITSIRTALCEIPLKQPIVTRRGTITTRPGWIIALAEQSGVIGIGEIAPLPDFGTEDWASAEAALDELKKQRGLPQCGTTLEKIAEWRERAGIFAAATPAVSYGLECALLSLAGHAEQRLPVELLSANPLHDVQVNALIGSGEPDEIMTEVQQAINAGYHSVKLKVSVHSLAEDIELAHSFADRFPNLRFRFDANSGWAPDGAAAFLEAAAKLPLDYVEDPVPADQLEELSKLVPASMMRIGLDETARDYDTLTKILPMFRKCARLAVVVKPALCGSFVQLRAYADLAGRNGAGLVVTSMFDSSIGLSYATLCAAAFGSSRMAHGLGTAEYLAEDTLEQTLRPEKGVLSLPDTRWLVWHLRAGLARHLHETE